MRTQDQELHILEKLARDVEPFVHLVHGEFFEFPTEFERSYRLYFNITEKPLKVHITRVEEYSKDKM